MTGTQSNTKPFKEYTTTERRAWIAANHSTITQREAGKLFGVTHGAIRLDEITMDVLCLRVPRSFPPRQEGDKWIVSEVRNRKKAKIAFDTYDEAEAYRLARIAQYRVKDQTRHVQHSSEITKTPAYLTAFRKQWCPSFDYAEEA